MKLPNFINNHRFATLLGVLLIIVVPTGFALKGRGSDIKYETAPVTKANITSVVQATGIINPLTTVPVGSFVSGTVQYVFADYNTRVKAGQVLALLDPSYYEAQYITAQGNLTNAQANVRNLQANIESSKATISMDQANVDKLKADANYAEVNGKRVTDLSTAGIYTKDQADLAGSTTAQAEAAVVGGAAQLNQAKSQDAASSRTIRFRKSTSGSERRRAEASGNQSSIYRDYFSHRRHHHRAQHHRWPVCRRIVCKRRKSSRSRKISSVCSSTQRQTNQTPARFAAVPISPFKWTRSPTKFFMAG